MLALCSWAGAETESLRPYLWENRVIVVFSPDDANAELLEQRQRVQLNRSGFEERDLVVVEIVGAKDNGLRKRFKTEVGSFRVLLIGKDGTLKDQSSRAFETRRLFEVIDAMPMRRREMRERGR